MGWFGKDFGDSGVYSVKRQEIWRSQRETEYLVLQDRAKIGVGTGQG